MFSPLLPIRIIRRVPYLPPLLRHQLRRLAVRTVITARVAQKKNTIRLCRHHRLLGIIIIVKTLLLIICWQAKTRRVRAVFILLLLLR